jgi:acetylornithine deacetylase
LDPEGKQMTGADVRQRVLDAVDRDEIVDLLQRAIHVPSVTGQEAAFAEWVREELEAAGAHEVGTFEFKPGRPDVWGVVRGAGGGRSVMFLSHLDTVHGGGWEERWRGTPNESPFGGAIVGGDVYGRGAGDVKAGIATALAALRTVRRARLKPLGDVVMLAVGDEESGEPGTGYSDGIKEAVRRMGAGEIPTADFAIYGEPTQLDIYTAQLGFIIAEVAVSGESAFWSTPWRGTDALRAGHRLLTRLFELAERIWLSREHPLIGRPSLLITEVSAGGQIAVPDLCVIKLIRKLIPGEQPAEAMSELEGLLGLAAIEDGTNAEIRYTAARDNPWGGTPAELATDHEGVSVLQDIVRDVAGKTDVIGGASYWSELGVLRDELGIPGVYCSPGDIRNCHTLEERVAIDELVDGVRTYSRFIAEFCGVEDASEVPQ